MKSIYLLLLCMSITFSCFAQQKGNCELKGHILDNVTNEHLSDVAVMLKGTTIGTTSDATGHFLLKNIPEGAYTVMLRYVGYQPLEIPVSFDLKKKAELSFSMIPSTFEMEAVVVSANRMETSRKEAPAIVNVLTPKLFELTNSTTLSEGLCYASGLRVENNCQNCGFQQVRINGLDGQYSQILIDSRPIISALTGVYGIEQIPAGMVDRVEILRGGGSALYGSNAIAGIINIITKEPNNNSGSLSHNLTMIGGKSAENTTDLNASLVSKDNTAGAYIFSSIKSRNPYDADNDGYTEIPLLRGTTTGFRGYYKPTINSKLTAEYHNITEHRRGGNNLSEPPHEADICEQTDHDINGGGLKYDIYSQDLKQNISIYASGQYTDRKSYYGAGKDPNAYGATTDATYDMGGQYSYNFEKLWFMPSSLIGGMEFNYDDLDDEALGYDRVTKQIVRIGSLFLQNEWKNEQFSILLGGRLDKHNLIDEPIFSPRINFRYNPIRDIGLRASYSQGFRAPQAFSEDLHIIAAGGDVILIELDPNLKPERSQSISASADLYHTFGQIETNLLVEGFFTDLSNVFILVEEGRDAQGNIIQEKRNGSGATVAGVTIEAKAAFNKKYQLQAGFTFQKSQYKEPEVWSNDVNVPATKHLFRSPSLYGYFTGTFEVFKNFSASVSGTYTGSMYIPHFAGYIEADKLEKTQDFFDANIKLAYTFTLKKDTKLQLNAGIQNIFNSYQKDFDKGPNRDSGYIYGPFYPRSYFAGLKIML